MKTFYSKIDWWIGLLFLVPLILPFIHAFVDVPIGDYKAFIVITVLYCGILIIFFPMRYVLEDDYLEIRLGLFLKGKFPYRDIIDCFECRMSLLEKAPVTSLDCVKITLRKKHKSSLFMAHDGFGHSRNYTIISPKNKKEFIRTLKEKLAIES